MKCPLPPKVELPDPPLGPLQALRIGRQNLVATIPGGVLEHPMVSGRTIWRWHSLSGVDAIRRVMVDNVDNYPKSRLMHRALRPAIRNSIMLDEGEHWAWQRRAMVPCLSARSIRNMQPDIDGAIDSTLADLPGEADFTRDALAIALKISLRVTCGLIDGGGKDAAFDHNVFQRAFTDYIATVGRATAFDMLGLPASFPQPWGRGRAKVLKRLHALMDGVIDRRLSNLQTGGQQDLLQAMIEAVDPQTGRKMSRERLRDNLLVAFVGGHETTANTLAWSLWLLATEPGWQDKIRNPAEADPSSPPDPDLDRVLNETMRLYSPFPLLFREAIHDDVILGTKIRAGDYVFIPIYALHRHRALWQDPDTFCPARFDDRGARMAQFQPFGSGPRTCPGATLAMTVMRTALSRILRTFSVRPAGPAPEPRALIALRPHGGVPLSFRRL